MNKTQIDNVIGTIVKQIGERTDIAIVGLSGGADSTLTATLCQIALGADKVYGIHMPYSIIDKEKFNTNSVKVARKLGIKELTFDIGDSYDPFADQMDNILGNLSEINGGNLRSRFRMVSLYTIACGIAEANPTAKVRVMGTGNLSEDFIGYDTKGGDALADFFPIGQLYKSEVYALLDNFVAEGVLDEDLIDRVPSAGLWDGQTDEDELGYSYNEMQDAVQFCLKNYDMMEAFAITNHPDMTDMVRFVWNRHITNKHKHIGPEVASLGLDREY